MLQTYIGDPGNPHYERLFCRSIAILQWIEQQNQTDRYPRDAEWLADRQDMLLDTLDLPPVRVLTGKTRTPKDARNGTDRLAQALMPLFNQAASGDALSASDVVPLMQGIAKSYAQSVDMQESDAILQGFRNSCEPSRSADERLVTDPSIYARKAWLAFSPPSEQFFRMNLDQGMASLDAALAEDSSTDALDFIYSLAEHEGIKWPDPTPRVSKELDRYRDGFKSKISGLGYRYKDDAVEPSQRPELAVLNPKFAQASRVLHEALGLPFDVAAFTAEYGMDSPRESRLRHLENLILELTNDPTLAHRFRRLRGQYGMADFCAFLARAQHELAPYRENRKDREQIKTVQLNCDPERLNEMAAWLLELSDDEELRTKTLREYQRLATKKNRHINSSFAALYSTLMEVRTTRDASKGKYDQDVPGLAKRALQDFYIREYKLSPLEIDKKRWWPRETGTSLTNTQGAQALHKRMAPPAAMPLPAKRHKPDAVMSVFEMKSLGDRVRSMDFVFNYPPMQKTLRHLAHASYDGLEAELAAPRPASSEEAQEMPDLSATATAAEEARHRQKQELVSLATPVLSRLKAVRSWLENTLPKVQLSWLFDAADDVARQVASPGNDASSQPAAITQKASSSSISPSSSARLQAFLPPEAFLPPAAFPTRAAGTIAATQPAAQPAWTEEAIRAQFQQYAGQPHTEWQLQRCVRVLSAAAAIQRLDTSGRRNGESEFQEQLQGLLTRGPGNTRIENPLMTPFASQAARDQKSGREALITTLASRTLHDQQHGQGTFIPKFVSAILKEARKDSGLTEALLTTTINRVESDIEEDDNLIEVASKYALSIWETLARDGQRNLHIAASEYVRELERRQAADPADVDWGVELRELVNFGGSLPDLPVTLIDALECHYVALAARKDAPRPASQNIDVLRAFTRTQAESRNLRAAISDFLGISYPHTPGLLTGIAKLEARLMQWNDGHVDVRPRAWRASTNESGAAAFADLLRNLRQELVFRSDLNHIVPDTLAALGTDENLRKQAMEITGQAGDDVYDRPVRVLVQLIEALTLHQATAGNYDGKLDNLLKVERATFELQKWEEMENHRREAIWSGARDASSKYFKNGYRPSRLHHARKESELLTIRTPDISTNEQEMERLATAVHKLMPSAFPSFLHREHSPLQAVLDRLDPPALAAATGELNRLALNPSSAADVVESQTPLR